MPCAFGAEMEEASGHGGGCHGSELGGGSGLTWRARQQNGDVEGKQENGKGTREMAVVGHDDDRCCSGRSEDERRGWR